MPTTNYGLPLTPDSVRISQLAKADRDLATAVDALWHGTLTTELIAAVGQEAATQITAAIVSRHLLSQDITDSPYAVAWTDDTGRASVLAALRDGTWPAYSVTDMGRQLGIALDAPAGYSLALLDDAGNVAPFSADSTGRATRAMRGDLARTFAPGFVAAGDSLTAGYMATGITYAAACAAIIGGSVINRAVPGEGAGDIAIRYGARPLSITLPGNTIPAATAPVAVTIPADQLGALRSWTVGHVSTWDGVLDGIPGTLTRTQGSADASWTWARTTAGDAISCTSATFRCADMTDHRPRFWWLKLGRNNTSPAQVAACLAAIAEILAWVGHDRVGIITIPAATTDDASSTACLHAINDGAAAMVEPGHVFDTATYLQSSAAFADAGIEQTAQDVTDAGTKWLYPSSFRADNVHMNATGYAAEGRWLATQLTERGLI